MKTFPNFKATRLGWINHDLVLYDSKGKELGRLPDYRVPSKSKAVRHAAVYAVLMERTLGPAP